MALATLVQGSTGIEVKNLQRGLNYHVPDEPPLLAVDGIFGPKTRARLVTFQNRHGLKPDAIVGPKTRQALYTFVVARHGLMHTTRSLHVAGAHRLNDTGPLPPAPILPPLRLPPYPARVPVPASWTFPLFSPIPHFRLDPQFYLWLRTQPFEIEAGTSMVFKKRSEDDGPGGTAFIEGTARIWTSPPMLGGRLSANSKVAFGGEKRIQFTNRGRTSDTEGHLAVAVGLEVEDLVPLGPLDLFTFQMEAQLKKSTDQKPVEFNATFEAGPTIKTKIGKYEFSFGPSAYFELGTDGRDLDMSWGVTGKGAIRF